MKDNPDPEAAAAAAKAAADKAAAEAELLRDPVVRAACEGDLGALQALHCPGGGPSDLLVFRDVEGWPMLLRAAAAGHLHVVRWMLECLGEDIEVQKGNGSTALFQAAYFGFPVVLNYLLEKGAAINYQRPDGVTALHLAAQEGKLQCTRDLLDQGADVTLLSEDSWTALYAASNNGHVDVCALLVERGCPINQGTQSGRSALWASALCGYVDCVKLLLDNGADADQTEEENWTPLFAAVRKDNLQVAKALIAAGAKVDIKIQTGQTALFSSSYCNQPEAVRMLLDAGADPNACEQGGWCPLFACCHQQDEPIALMLLQAGANPNLTTETVTFSALGKAIQVCHPGLTRLLLSFGADHADATAPADPLSYACRVGKAEHLLEVVTLLLEPPERHPDSTRDPLPSPYVMPSVEDVLEGPHSLDKLHTMAKNLEDACVAAASRGLFAVFKKVFVAWAQVGPVLNMKESFVGPMLLAALEGSVEAEEDAEESAVGDQQQQAAAEGAEAEVSRRSGSRATDVHSLMLSDAQQDRMHLLRWLLDQGIPWHEDVLATCGPVGSYVAPVIRELLYKGCSLPDSPDALSSVFPEGKPFKDMTLVDLCMVKIRRTHATVRYPLQWLPMDLVEKLPGWTLDGDSPMWSSMQSVKPLFSFLTSEEDVSSSITHSSSNSSEG